MPSDGSAGENSATESNRRRGPRSQFTPRLALRLGSFAATAGAFALALAAVQPKPHSFEWPDSSHYWRALLSVNQYIETRPRAWFVRDKVVVDLQVLKVPATGEGGGAEIFARVRKQLESRGMNVGTYISGTSVAPLDGENAYPPPRVAIEQMPASAKYASSWPGQPERKIIDVSDVETRHAFQANIAKMWQAVPAPVRFVDNAGIHPKVERAQSWDAYCANIKEIRQLAESQGARSVYNIAIHVGLMTDDDARKLIDAIGRDNGIALEMPWHPNIQKSPQETAKAVARYRQLLDNGIVVIMIPVKMEPVDLANWIRTWRKPGDRLYISGPFWKPPDPQAYGGQ